MQILLVEDDLTLGKSLQRYLESENFSVVWVNDGKQALDKAENVNFDIYLFDINIPFLDGFELLKQLREKADNTPCIFITAKEDTSSLVHGFDLGADDYIKKPFDVDELLARIKKLIGKDSLIKYNDITYDTNTRVITRHNEIVILSPGALKLFETFILNIGKPIQIEQFGKVSSTRVYISELKKLGLRIRHSTTLGYICEAYSRLPARRKR
jgi:DNA-binding response OmpR family regulator